MNFKERKLLQNRNCLVFSNSSDSIMLTFRKNLEFFLEKKGKFIDFLDLVIDRRIYKAYSYLQKNSSNLIEGQPVIVSDNIIDTGMLSKYSKKNTENFDFIWFEDSKKLVRQVEDSKINKKYRDKDLNRIIISKFLDSLHIVSTETFLQDFVESCRSFDISMFQSSIEFLNLDMISNLAHKFELENNFDLRCFVASALNAFKSRSPFLPEEIHNKFEIWKLSI